MVLRARPTLAQFWAGVGLFLFACQPLILPKTMLFLTPLNRQVIQRNNSNAAVVAISGSYTSTPTPVKIHCRLVPIKDGQGVATDWQDMTFSAGKFSGKMTARGGWYRLEAEALNSIGVAQEVGTVDHLGIGEVFVIAGHSVAAGGVSYINGASDDRVITIPMEIGYEDSPRAKTGSLADMPTTKFVQFGTGISPAPFGYNCYFWSRFGELVAQRLNVPVLIYQTAFGGTNLEHWAKSSQGEEFALFSVPPSFHMPYINLKHVIQKYVPVTGLRAVLIDHGQNDYRELDEDLLLNRYLIWVNQARTDIGQATLAAVINRQTPFLTVDSNYQGDPPMRHIRRVQEKMAATPNCFVGPDYDTGLAVTDRYDNIHLSDSGQTKAAKLWADALTNSFFLASDPHLTEAVTTPIDPTRVVTDLPLAVVTSTSTLDPVTPVVEALPVTTNMPTTPATSSTGGILSASVLPDLSQLSNYALLGLAVLAVGFTAFLLHQFVNKD
ncbi:hypothetical protein GO755_33410 [Spirosoma sp. HMF4905]|uniref:Sialate O-acetylesterase domain-containing protein n=1 Tax=Spirosoma arboris TaxID=2682092 RepID=A0A7K1SMF7_9BACT|nr:hypothetical protein [Spirosoma arboris]MVM34974.1 hypothetical protein [Spirosoma arboris]